MFAKLVCRGDRRIVDLANGNVAIVSQCPALVIFGCDANEIIVGPLELDAHSAIGSLDFLHLSPRFVALD